MEEVRNSGLYGTSARGHRLVRNVGQAGPDVIAGQVREAGEDRGARAVKTPRRFRVRIRDWLILVVLVALVAGGMAHVIRVRHLQAEREWAKAIRAHEEAQETIRASEAWIRASKKLLKKLEA